MRLRLLATFHPRASRRAGLAWLVAVFALSGLWVHVAHAQQSPTLDRLAIGIGGYYATSDTTVGASIPEGFAAASINLENDLGLDNRGLSARIRADVLIGDHQGLSFDYYRYDRDNAQAWQRSIDWQGTAHHLQAKLDGRLAFAFGSVAWRWWFGSGNNVIGLGLGASHYRASARLVGSLQVDGKSYDFDEHTGTGAWAPLLQLGWRHMFTPQWRMYFSGAGVFKNGGKLQGHIYNASLGVEWLPMRHLGFAVEYGINSIHIKQSHEHYRDSLDLELNGPSAFVYLRF
ncbi:MAG TPA: hypothetical protein VFK31_01360 [Rhodanobacteraceae bacterium]|nr:hypothetical protein [Rhodanobacteraceae bacterium]